METNKINGFLVLSALLAGIGCHSPDAADIDDRVDLDIEDVARDGSQDDAVSKSAGVIWVFLDADGYGYWPANYTTTSLQAALNYANARPSRKAFIWLNQGTYRNDESSLSVTMKDWRNSCSPKSALTAFLLKGRTAKTFFRSVYSDPSKVVIWGKVPDHVVTSPGTAPNIKMFHGFTLENNTGEVHISNVSIVSDGGYFANGGGDASLNVVNSKGSLSNSIVLANKTSSNCLWGDPELDQEGIVLYGSSTNFSVLDSAVGGNLHTGIMLLDGAEGWVEGSLIRGNGWGVAEVQNNHKGHGITSFHNEIAASCLDGNTKLNVIDSYVRNNSGDGVYVRGNFDGTAQAIDFNDIHSNQGAGVRVDGGGWTGSANAKTRFRNGAWLSIMDNHIYNNPAGCIVVDSGTVIPASAVHHNGCNGSGAMSPELTSLWTKLLNVKSSMAGIPVTCP